jgi:hypothetical protein
MPSTRATQARFCTTACRVRTNSRKWALAHPEYIRDSQLRRYRANPEPQRVRQRRLYRIASYGRDPGENPLAYTKDKYRHARALGYRSGLEVAVAKELTDAGVKFQYETLVMPFTPKPKRRAYHPDIVLPNGVVIELKGRFVTADRQKHLAVKSAHPDVEVRFVFSNSSARISKQSRTTYAVWCGTNGFLYADKHVPPAWIAESPNRKSLAAIAALMEDHDKK